MRTRDGKLVKHLVQHGELAGVLVDGRLDVQVCNAHIALQARQLVEVRRKQRWSANHLLTRNAESAQRRSTSQYVERTVIKPSQPPRVPFSTNSVEAASANAVNLNSVAECAKCHPRRAAPA